jgi:hypothetical protein
MMILVAAISLMFIGAGALLIRGFMDFSKIEAQLRNKYAELEHHYHRNPFPSSENLKIEQENLTILDEQLADLLMEMGKGQIQSLEQSPPKFIAQFWATQKELLQKAKNQGITVAPTFDFGFGRHMAGTPPAPQDVARLTQQLRIVQQLTHTMYDAGITELTGIGRQEFEVDAKAGSPAAAAPGRRSRVAASAVSLNVYEAKAGLIPDGQLYGRWHFSFRLTAREGALLALLNQLARESLFVVVSDLDIEGDDSIKASGAEATSRGGPKSPVEITGEAVSGSVSRDLVCGRDVPLRIKLEVDVYQFMAMKPVAAVKKGRVEK